MRSTQIHLKEGMTVYSRDGEKIGDIAQLGNDYFLIEKGFIFTEDIYLPMSAVSGTRDDEGIHITLTKDEIENGDWSSPPRNASEGSDVGYAGQHTGRATDASRAETGYDTAGRADTDRNVIERREERLAVDKQREKTGEVHVGKHVTEEEQSVDVPVTREEVTMERRSVDRPASGSTTSDDRIDVPVYEEHAEADKEARVVEEMEVGKTAKTDTERVGGTVRREEFDVDDDTSRP